MWPWHNADAGWWGFGMMAISMVLFWALLILLAVALLRYITRDARPSDSRLTSRADGLDTADRLLAERFARGEIDADQYRTSRDALHRTGL